jgi:two-component system response regulator FixJ
MNDARLVYIIEDEAQIRRSVGFMLKTSGYTVKCWRSGPAFLKEVQHLDPGCILLELRMPEMNGLEVQQALIDRGITMPVVVVSGDGDIATAVRAMKAHAVAVIEMPFAKRALCAAIEEAHAWLDTARAHATDTAGAQVVINGLTAREHDVLRGLVHGLRNKAIGYDLGISPRTVEVHRARIMIKLGAHSLSDTLRVAFAAGLGDIP